MPKILHCADIHLDTPFKSGSVDSSFVRRKELRDTFSSLMNYIKSNGIELAVIAGDLFDSGLVTKDTAAFVVSELAGASPCRFVISPGNHDPYTEKGVYGVTDFPENVFIFREPSLSKFSFPELNTDVYGYAFTSSTLEYNPFAGRTPDDSMRINILAAHADVGSPLSVYCPVTEADIAASGFDYCAFGHIHLSEGGKKAGSTVYAYSGCLEGRDFGETGHKGAVVADIEKERGIASVKLSGVRFSSKQYEIAEVDLSGVSEAEQLLQRAREAILDGGYDKDTLLRLILSGNVSPSLKIRTAELEAVLGKELYYIEVFDKTLPLYDAEKLDSDPTIRGAFFRELKPLLENGTQKERQDAAYALRIGLLALSGEDIQEV